LAIKALYRLIRNRHWRSPSRYHTKSFPKALRFTAERGEGVRTSGSLRGGELQVEVHGPQAQRSFLPQREEVHPDVADDAGAEARQPHHLRRLRERSASAASGFNSKATWFGI
jgi:hypothetical protein